LHAAGRAAPQYEAELRGCRTDGSAGVSGAHVLLPARRYLERAIELAENAADA
jgi:hypothetical protein